MKTSTPLTDKEARSGGRHASTSSPFVTAEFARKLEVAMRALADAMPRHAQNCSSQKIVRRRLQCGCVCDDTFEECDCANGKALEQFNSLKS